MKKLTCHCGEIQAEIKVSGNLEKVLRCNCSICKRKGSIMAMVKNEDFKIVRGKEKLNLYQFHSKIAKHFFCSICGIYTHHRRRRDDGFGVNTGCLDRFSIDDLDEVVSFKGSELSVVED